MYNGMAGPVVPYAIRGALWYQGEANGDKGDTYFHKMHALYAGWQKRWGQQLPFYYAQLASFVPANTSPEGGDGWAKIREAQRRMLTVPGTGMIVLTDVGEADIHPRNKFEVGKRFALLALAKNYGTKDVVCSGPIYKSVAFGNGKATVAFDHCKGLKAAKKRGPHDLNDPVPTDELTGFAIAGEDKKWFWADAKIVDDKVVLSSKDVERPCPFGKLA